MLRRQQKKKEACFELLYLRGAEAEVHIIVRWQSTLTQLSVLNVMDNQRYSTLLLCVIKADKCVLSTPHYYVVTFFQGISVEARKTISQELNIYGSYMNSTVSETYDLAKLTHWTSFKAYIWKLGESYPKSYIFTKPLNKKQFQKHTILPN